MRRTIAIGLIVALGLGTAWAGNSVTLQFQVAGSGTWPETTGIMSGTGFTLSYNIVGGPSGALPVGGTYFYVETAWEQTGFIPPGTSTSKVDTWIYYDWTQGSGSPQYYLLAQMCNATATDTFAGDANCPGNFQTGSSVADGTRGANWFAKGTPYNLPGGSAACDNTVQSPPSPPPVAQTTPQYEYGRPYTNDAQDAFADLWHGLIHYGTTTVTGSTCMTDATHYNAARTVTIVWDDGAVGATGTVFGLLQRAQARTTLTLTPDKTCYKVNDDVIVNVVLSDGTSEIVGGQYWLQYDPNSLSYTPGTGNPQADAPWSVLIYSSHDVGNHVVFVSVGIPDGGTGATAGAMATLKFKATAETCGTAELVKFKTPDGDPPTRLADRYDNVVYPEKVNLEAVTIDGTPPTATQGTIGACYPDPNSANAAALAATTDLTDNCGATGVTKAVYTGAGMCDTSIVIRVTDSCGNYTNYTYYTRVDSTPPSATQGTINACYPDPNSANAVALAATTDLDDNCGATGVTKAVYTGAGTCDTSIVIRVTDSCGNYTDYTYYTRVDSTPPVVTCPANIARNADAGLCTAAVTWSAATAIDNCDGDISATVRYDIDLGNDGSIDVSNYASTTYPFPAGTHKVIAKATDTCNNTGSCFFLVTVSGFNELVVDLALRGGTAFAASFNRCITFEFDGPTQVKQVITFHGPNGTANNVSVLVPCGSYTCIRARDDLHTLWAVDSSTFGISDTPPKYYYASFTNKGGGNDDRLVLGNLNGDDWIDVLDFGIYVTRFGTHPPVNLTCSYTTKHPDFNGDGIVDSTDFSYIQTYFLFGDESGCSSKFMAGGGPITRIAVTDLAQYGLEELAGADLNGDGWIDELDIAAFADGAVPQPPPPPPAPLPQPKPAIHVGPVQTGPVEAEPKSTPAVPQQAKPVRERPGRQ